MIDLHCHLLPGLDDGPASEDASLALAAEIAAGGVKTLAATPHLRADFPDVRVLELAARVKRCARSERRGARARLRRRGRRAVGADRVRRGAARRDVRRARQRTCWSRRRTASCRGCSRTCCSGCRVRGFRILLAHPERNPSFQADPARLERLVDGGTLVQLTASSIVGRRPRAARLSRAADRRRQRARDRQRHAPRGRAAGVAGRRRGGRRPRARALDGHRRARRRSSPASRSLRLRRWRRAAAAGGGANVRPRGALRPPRVADGAGRARGDRGRAGRAAAAAVDRARDRSGRQPADDRGVERGGPQLRLRARGRRPAGQRDAARRRQPRAAAGAAARSFADAGRSVDFALVDGDHTRRRRPPRRGRSARRRTR